MQGEQPAALLVHPRGSVTKREQPGRGDCGEVCGWMEESRTWGCACEDQHLPKHLHQAGSLHPATTQAAREGGHI